MCVRVRVCACVCASVRACACVYACVRVCGKLARKTRDMSRLLP